MAEEAEEKQALMMQLQQEVPDASDPLVPDQGDSGMGSGMGGGMGGGPQDDIGENPFVEGASNESNRMESDDPVEAFQDTILESIFATAIQNKNDGQAYVTTGEVEERLVDRLPDEVGTSLSEISNIFERMSRNLVEKDRIEGEVHVRLTNAGEATVFERDTGSAGSGGGDDHRWVLRESYIAFTKIGYESWLPEQEGAQQPDGVADTPIDIRDIDPELPPSEFTKEIEKRQQRLQEQYPAVWELSQGDDISVEAETSTLNKPFQTFNNLKKAQAKSAKCVFAVKDESADKDDFAYWAKRAERVIYKSTYEGRSRAIDEYTPTFRKAPPNDDDYPRFYNFASGSYKLDDEKTALRPTTDASRSVWYHDTDSGEIVCAPSNQQAIVEEADEIRFDSKEAVEEGDPTAVPAYYTYNQSEQKYVVNNNGEELIYPTREEMEEDWETFKGPFIPENEFEEGIPDDDDFMIIIFPDADNPEYDQPQIYHHGECKPLYDEVGVDVEVENDRADIAEVDIDPDADAVVDEDVVDEEAVDDASDEGATEQSENVGESEGEGEAEPSGGGDNVGDDGWGGSNGDGEPAPEATADSDSQDGPASGESDSGSEQPTGSVDIPADIRARIDPDGPIPKSINPGEIMQAMKGHPIDVEQGVVQAIATGSTKPPSLTDSVGSDLRHLIQQIDKETWRFIDSPDDFAFVIGNAKLDQVDRSQLREALAANGGGQLDTTDADSASGEGQSQATSSGGDTQASADAAHDGTGETPPTSGHADADSNASQPATAEGAQSNGRGDSVDVSGSDGHGEGQQAETLSESGGENKADQQSDSTPESSPDAGPESGGQPGGNTGAEPGGSGASGDAAASGTEDQTTDASATTSSDSSSEATSGTSGSQNDTANEQAETDRPAGFMGPVKKGGSSGEDTQSSETEIVGSAYLAGGESSSADEDSGKSDAGDAGKDRDAGDTDTDADPSTDSDVDTNGDADIAVKTNGKESEETTVTVDENESADTAPGGQASATAAEATPDGGESQDSTAADPETDGHRGEEDEAAGNSESTATADESRTQSATEDAPDQDETEGTEATSSGDGRGENDDNGTKHGSGNSDVDDLLK
jgi:hypothetical protein